MRRVLVHFMEFYNVMVKLTPPCEDNNAQELKFRVSQFGTVPYQTET